MQYCFFLEMEVNCCFWKNLCSGMNRFRTAANSDIQLETSDGQLFWAHSVVLVASCEFFRNVIVKRDGSINQNLQLTNVTGIQLKVIFHYIIMISKSLCDLLQADMT